MSKGNAKTNHHYVPRGYLAHFTIPGEKSLIWQYDKLAQKFSKAPKSIHKIASRKNYYAFTSNTGGLDTNTIEDAFQKIETEAISIMRQIFPGKLSILLNNNHEKSTYYLIT
ncbi:MAG TPA: DUF4238 domain-containing protein [Nitratidesulfovibrio sp.]|nr:DUF4238 domain-containing protein [Nitratidesulfovibrio sp.]